MDLYKCEVLLKAVDVGSFTKAAEDLGYTPSGITHMMNAFEEELGFPLLHRSRSGVVLTEGGRFILPMLRELISKKELLIQAAADFCGLSVGTVKIGTFPSVSRLLLPRIVSNFGKDYPSITLELLEGGQEETDEWIAERKVDLAFTSRQPNKSCDWLPLMQDELLAIVPVGHRLASKKEIEVSELGNDPFLMLGADYEQDVPKLIKAAKYKPNIRLYSQDELTVIAMVHESLGVSIIPGMHLLRPHEDVITLSLIPKVYRQLGIAVPSIEELSPAAKKFILCVQAMVGNNPIEAAAHLKTS